LAIFRPSWVLALMVWAAGAAAAARAHEFQITDALFVLKSDDTWIMDLRVDIDALALGVPPSTDSAWVKAQLEQADGGGLEEAIERARRTLLTRVRVRFDGQRAEPILSFPEHGTALASEAEIPTLLGVTARFSGRVPAGAKSVAVHLSRAFGPMHCTIVEQRTGNLWRESVEAGGETSAFVIGAAAESRPAGAGDRATTAWRYVVLGFEHILPLGLDHILFVLGLFLLGVAWQPLLWQVTAFTIAHSITLAMSMYEVVSLPAQFVETMIALSIAYVGIENLFVRRIHAGRVALVFAFGLLHGLGFAGVLTELGLPWEQFALALVAFNVGVELGQLAVLALAFAALGWFMQKAYYRNWIARPLSGLIALTGLWWAVERAVG
jgi:hypothetical protein